MPRPANEVTRLLERYRRGELDDEALLERLARLESREDADSGPNSDTHEDADTAAARTPLAARLDEYRAAEASGAATLETWAGLSSDPALVGGLRTAAAREAKHASLLERRVRELGGSSSARIPRWLADFNARITDPAATDLERLRLIVERFPDVDSASQRVLEMADAIVGDELTRELLRAICVDELATLEWAHEAYCVRAGAGRA